MMFMKNQANPLSDFRAEIDRIDDALHDLIMRRAGVVLQIAAVKSQAAGAANIPALAIRPGREAQILRRLLARHSGALPGAVIARVWRELISAKIGLQGPLEMAVFGGPEPLAGWDVARSHFGSVTPATLYHSSAQVLGRVAEGKGVIGVLPAPAGGDLDGEWWPVLANTLTGDGDTGVRIIARLPFARRASSPEPEMVAVARCEREASGDDRSYLLLFCRNEISRASARQLLAAHGIEAEPVDAGKGLMLFDARGYIADDDPRLAGALAAPENPIESPIERIVVVGGYATPLQLPA